MQSTVVMVCPVLLGDSWTGWLNIKSTCDSLSWIYFRTYLFTVKIQNNLTTLDELDTTCICRRACEVQSPLVLWRLESLWIWTAPPFPWWRENEPMEFLISYYLHSPLDVVNFDHKLLDLSPVRIVDSPQDRHFSAMELEVDDEPPLLMRTLPHRSSSNRLEWCCSIWNVLWSCDE